MPFLNPWLLLATTAVGVPVLIHLLNRHRAVTIEWGAMVLLRKVMKFRSRQIRLEDLLLLLLRCLIILLVVLAAARPTTQWSGIIRKPDVGVVIAVDASLSMAHRPGLESRFDHALDRTREILKSVEPGSPITLVMLGARPRILVRSTGYDPGRCEEALSGSKPLAESLNLERCLGELAELFAEIKTPERELYLVTDGQATTWGRLSDKARQGLSDLRGSGRVFLVAVENSGSQNLAVTHLELAAGVLRVGALVRYQAEICNFGPEPQEGVEASLLVDDQVVEKRFVGRLGPGESASVPLYAVLHREGITRISVRLGDDPLPDDNVAYTVAQVRRTVRVLCVDGEPSDRPHGGATAYVAAALAPGGLEHPDLTMEVETIPWLSLAAARLRDYDVVLLANVPGLVDEAAAALGGFVEQGGGLILFLGQNSKPENLNRRLGQGEPPLLPAELISSFADPGGAQDGMRMDWTSLDYPVVRPLRSLPLDLLSESRVYRLFKVRPLPESRTLLKLSGGEPLLLEKSYGRGKVLLFTSSADRSWHNLVVNPAYPIMLHHAVMYLLQQLYEQPLTIPQPLVLPLPSVQPGSEVLVTDPDGVTSSITATQRNGQASVELAETLRPGYYLIQADKHAPAIPVAVNLAPGESDVKTLDAEALGAAVTSCGIQVLAADQNITAAVAQSRAGRELWFLLLLTAVGLLAVESLVARWYTRHNGG